MKPGNRHLWPANGKTGWLLLWVFGVPMPILLLLLVLRDLAYPRPP